MDHLSLLPCFCVLRTHHCSEVEIHTWWSNRFSHLPKQRSGSPCYMRNRFGSPSREIQGGGDFRNSIYTTIHLRLVVYHCLGHNLLTLTALSFLTGLSMAPRGYKYVTSRERLTEACGKSLIVRCRFLWLWPLWFANFPIPLHKAYSSLTIAGKPLACPTGHALMYHSQEVDMCASLALTFFDWLSLSDSQKKSSEVGSRARH